MNATMLEAVDKLSKLEKLALAKYLLDEVSKEEMENIPHSGGEPDPVIGYDVAGNPLLASVAKKLFQTEVARVRQGEYITIEDLEKEAQTW